MCLMPLRLFPRPPRLCPLPLRRHQNRPPLPNRQPSPRLRFFPAPRPYLKHRRYPSPPARESLTWLVSPSFLRRLLPLSRSKMAPGPRHFLPPVRRHLPGRPKPLSVPQQTWHRGPLRLRPRHRNRYRHRLRCPPLPLPRPPRAHPAPLLLLQNPANPPRRPVAAWKSGCLFSASPSPKAR